MFCENCGKNLPDGVRFCDGCGAKTAPSQPVRPEAEQPAMNAVPPPFNTPPAPVPPRNTYAPPQQSYAPQQQSYAQPQQSYTPQHTYMPPSYAPQPGSEPLRVGQYIAMFLLLSIPLVGIILLFMWAFGGAVNPNKKNFARAMLILGIIGVVFSFIFGAVLMSAISGLLSSMGGYY